MPFKCPTLGSIQVIKCPHPGDISQAHKWLKDGRNAFTCRTKSLQIQQIIRIQYNKNWETLLAYLLRAKVSCKAAEIAATRSPNAELFFVYHATYKAFYKKNTYWDYYIMTISLTCIRSRTLLINIHAAGESNWPKLLSFLLYWIAGIGIVFHCKHNLVHSYIQSLNPVLKMLKQKYLQIRHKACLSPFLVTNWPQRHNLFLKNPLTPRPPWWLATPETSYEIEGAVQIPAFPPNAWGSNSPPPGGLW